MNLHTDTLEINKALDLIGDAVMTSLAYQCCDENTLQNAMSQIDFITQNPSSLLNSEIDFKSSGKNYVLFYISDILYNLKTKNEFELTPDILMWLGSVWKNFLKRNQSYQKFFSQIEMYRRRFTKYYPNEILFIYQLKNVTLVKEDFVNKDTTGNNALLNLETFLQSLVEILSWIRPTYFFLLDYYYDKQLKSKGKNDVGVKFETDGIGNFGQKNYTYKDLLVLSGQCLSILEAVYLILKKKQSLKRIINIDGKQKFLNVSEIYNIYLEKFNETKKELSKLSNGR